MKYSKIELHKIGPPFIALMAMIGCCLVFYPGAMSWDSLEQLRQARSNEYGDWQPPAMAFLWRHLLWISDGPGMMLILQMAMLFSATVILYFWSLRNNNRWSAVFLLLPFLPWVVNFQFAIWKDVELAYSWLLAVAIAISYSDRQKFSVPAFIFIILLFLYGFLVRANSLAGAIFVFPFLMACIFKKNSIKFFLLTSSCAVLFFLLLPTAVNSALLAKVTHPPSYIMFDDLAALKLKGANVPDSIFQPLDVAELERCESLKQHRVGAPFCINEKFEDVRINNYKALKTAWFSAVSENFPAYISYRIGAFLSLMRSPYQEPYYYTEFRIVNSPYTFDSDVPPNSKGIELFVQYIQHSKSVFSEVFKPYFWLVASLLVCVALLKEKTTTAPLWMLPLSGFTYTLGFLPTTPAIDFRYVYWLCLIVTVSIMLWMTTRFKTRQKKISDVG